MPTQPLWTNIKRYCQERLQEIKAINDDPKHQCPSAFVCIAAFMGFLSRLASGTNLSTARDDGLCFKNFVQNYMPQKYRGQTFPDLLYKTFRCGIVHAMSFDPEITGNRTVYLASVGGATSGYAKLAITHDKHWSSLCGGAQLIPEVTSGMYVLVADVLCDDIDWAIVEMFNNPAVQNNSEEYVRTQRPIAGVPFLVPYAVQQNQPQYTSTGTTSLSSSEFPAHNPHGATT